MHYNQFYKLRLNASAETNSLLRQILAAVTPSTHADAEPPLAGEPTVLDSEPGESVNDDVATNPEPIEESEAIHA